MTLKQAIAELKFKDEQIAELVRQTEEQNRQIEKGFEADFVLLDPQRKWTVGPDTLRSRSRNSSFLGETLKGAVVATFLRGRPTYHTLAGDR